MFTNMATPLADKLVDGSGLAQPATHAAASCVLGGVVLPAVEDIAIAGTTRGVPPRASKARTER